jgi:hypothetical protein
MPLRRSNSAPLFFAFLCFVFLFFWLLADASVQKSAPAPSHRLLEEVNGAISTGKEAVVFHATR